jgi:DNA-binding response OmpR family regulator
MDFLNSGPAMRILLVEDDELLGDGLQAGLRHCGFNADWLQDGELARNALKTEDYAAIVLDLGLPRLDGLSLLRWLRGAGKTLPVLVLTARDTTPDKVDGLDSGADDYLVKPVDLDELAARLRALIRRAAGQAAPLLRNGALVLDPAARRVWLAEEAIDLPAKELAILEILMRNVGRVLSRGQLEASLYGWSDGIDSNAIEVHIHHLRRKLGADTIRTQRGLGYILEKR